MLKETDINEDDALNNFSNSFRKSLQSANINFLIGSGCSCPYIPALGDIEQQITKEYKEGNTAKANKLLITFLTPFIKFLNSIKDSNFDIDFSSTLNDYVSFIGNIGKLLFHRKNNILHKQASIFSTNYDLFIELAYENYTENLILCDGFKRTPSVNRKSYFSISEYFNTVYNIGNIYNYQVEIPSINLIKLHGSLNWNTDSNKIFSSIEYTDKVNDLLKSTKPEDIDKLIDSFSIVLPKKDKFKETIINQTYYDLLRVFANELDKENTLLISEGFSFADEHIQEVVKRSLRNPTLKLIIFCYEISNLETYKSIFDNFNNVEIIYSSKAKIKFNRFNDLLALALPGFLNDIDIKNAGSK